ncbi:MAG TPA: DEAD/DEAH box helicase family protein [Candidatus Caccocola faecipullorum]|nr:DEAD/DEAH box helicase family protein [Candidatus Caccocola faecipullorum]
MPNFTFLTHKPEYAIFAAACVEAENIFPVSPALCAVGCRKALELAVKWVYAADKMITMPYRDNLQSLIHERTFREAMGNDETWGKLPFVVRLGNLAVHTARSVGAGDALASLRALFEFVEWIDYCYGADYEERAFDEKLLPRARDAEAEKRAAESERLVAERDARIEALLAQIREMSALYTEKKEEHRETRRFEPEDLSEFGTRKIYIDVEMKEAGWKFSGADADVAEEYPVGDMAGVPGQAGFADYVLFGRDGLPLAVVEAKRASRDPNAGRRQAELYADALERKFGRRPAMFTTNGFETFFWDDASGPQRRVSGIFSREDLQKLIDRRSGRRPLSSVRIDDKITDRYYQKEAVRAVCAQVERGARRHLLVMATGTGKTRTASSLVDVLSRGGYVTNVLFLADRIALVKQAKDAFKNYLPDMSLCNLCSNRDDKSARIVFSTYPTMLNAIDSARAEDGRRLFTPAHFDLIIIDESHRSIFKKYRAIFDYFDAMLVGLTATPKTDVDRNTYEFFEMEQGVPTYAYDYDTAVNADRVLVPYYNYEVRTKFLEEGITYDDLSDEDKERYEDDFAEDGEMPQFIPSAQLNKFVFNETTVDTVLQDLMENGIRVEGGDRLGKSIVFAQNKDHAEFVVERFNKLYPQYRGRFARRVVCDDSYAQTLLEDFEIPDKEPHIAVSVDMMDTGIDVPEAVNLVFFKKVRSKTKFWQMVGRGTRLCPGLRCVDKIDGEYTDKRRFIIFDYCGNFEYFRAHKEGFDGREVKTLSESLFGRRVKLAAALEDGAYCGEDFQSWRRELTERCRAQVAALNTSLVSVRLNLRWVEKFKLAEAYAHIGESDKSDLLRHVAPLVYSDEDDEFAKRFDNFMYGLILAKMEKSPAFRYARKQLCAVAEALERKAAVPQVAEKLDFIREAQTEEFWSAGDILLFERARRELRELIKFLDDGGEERRRAVTKLADPVLERREGERLEAGYDFDDYRAKVNQYINEHGDIPAIYKLTHNVPLTREDYAALERVLTVELGSAEDYRREFGETPFGLLVRSIAKMDRAAAMEAFSKFINDQSLNDAQIAFVSKVISYIEQNGYMEAEDLRRPPFDKKGFARLFDARTGSALISAINAVRDNAVNVRA